MCAAMCTLAMARYKFMPKLPEFRFSPLQKTEYLELFFQINPPSLTKLNFSHYRKGPYELLSHTSDSLYKQRPVISS